MTTVVVEGYMRSIADEESGDVTFLLSGHRL